MHVSSNIGYVPPGSDSFNIHGGFVFGKITRTFVRSSSQIYIKFLLASFKYASLAALVELCGNLYLLLSRIMRSL